MDPLVPEYRFQFIGGVANKGIVEHQLVFPKAGAPSKTHYRLNDESIVNSLSTPLPTSIADLIDVAIAIHIADCLALREVEADIRFVQDRWHRRIHLVVPVRCLQRWSNPETSSVLAELLHYLTDDDWTVEFAQRSQPPRRSELQATLPLFGSSTTIVTPFSGGLDSLAGIVSILSSSTPDLVIPITVVTNARNFSIAHKVLSEVRRNQSAGMPSMHWARLHLGISGADGQRFNREHSQRARGLLFLASGAATTLLAHCNRLLVCENGIGAISLSMTSDHWGARTTKAMHPRTLNLFSKLISRLFEVDFGIDNLGLFATKGDLVKQLAKTPFIGAARFTASCDQATYRRRGEACGQCTSCILRRVSLLANNLEAEIDGDLRYETDWLNPATIWKGDQSTHLIAMRMQLEQLREAADHWTFVELYRAFPLLLDVTALAPLLRLSEPEVERKLLALYRAYIKEFGAMIARIDRPNWGRLPDVIAFPTRHSETVAV
jgi:hypothetical protein